MRAMKNGSVLGCTFWQAGVLTLSRRDQWGFSSLSMSVSTLMHTPALVPEAASPGL